jgi:hypothetical protein
MRDKWVLVTTAWRVLRSRMEKRPQLWKVAVNILNEQSRTADKGWSFGVRVSRGAPHRINCHVMILSQLPRAGTDSLVKLKQCFDRCIQNFGRET